MLGARTMAQCMIDAVAIPRLGDDLSLPASNFSNDYHSHFGNILATFWQGSQPIHILKSKVIGQVCMWNIYSSDRTINVNTFLMQVPTGKFFVSTGTHLLRIVFAPAVHLSGDPRCAMHEIQRSLAPGRCVLVFLTVFAEAGTPAKRSNMISSSSLLQTKANKPCCNNI